MTSCICQEEENEENTSHLQLNGTCVDLDGFGEDRHFEFDTVLDQDATQAQADLETHA